MRQMMRETQVVTLICYRSRRCCFCSNPTNQGTKYKFPPGAKTYLLT